MTTQEMLFAASTACFAAGGVFLVIATRYFITRDIRGVYADLAGRLGRDGAYERHLVARRPAGGGSKERHEPREPEMTDHVLTEALRADDGTKAKDPESMEKSGGQEFVVTRRIVCVHADWDAQ